MLVTLNLTNKLILFFYELHAVLLWRGTLDRAAFSYFNTMVCGQLWA